VGGPGFEVCREPYANLRFVAPGHDRIDQAIAADVFEVRIAPSEGLQIVALIEQVRHVKAHVLAGGGTGLGWIRFEYQRLFDANPRLRTDLGADVRRVLRWDKVRMGAVGLRRREVEHFGVERRSSREAAAPSCVVVVLRQQSISEKNQRQA
jgi:hypothetical protein